MPVSDMVRVVLLPTDGEGGSASDRQITIDVLIDADGSVIGPFPAFGRVGDFKRPATIYPFTLMGDGRIDYGAHASDAGRQDKLAIRAMQVALGAQIHHMAGDRTEVFSIETVIPLAA